MYDDISLLIRLEIDDEKKPYLEDFTALLYDFELLHDLSLILYGYEFSEYCDYKFPRTFWYRGKRPTRDEHRIRLFRIVKESPLEIITVVSAAVITTGAIWAILKPLIKIDTWLLERKKKQLDTKQTSLNIEKTALEICKLKEEIGIATDRDRLLEYDVKLLEEKLKPQPYTESKHYVEKRVPHKRRSKTTKRRATAEMEENMLEVEIKIRERNCVKNFDNLYLRLKRNPLQIKEIGFALDTTKDENDS